MTTKISWADETWSPIIGCSKISAGCQNCYAERMAARLANMNTPGYCDGVVELDEGRDLYLPKWTSETVMLPAALTKPLHWRKPRKIFVVSMGDLFHESVPFEWVLKILGIIIATPWHQYYFLTKRAGRMREFFAPYPDGWLIREGMKHTSFSYEFFALNAISNVITDAQVKKANDYWKSHYDQSKRGKLDGPVPHPVPNLHLGVTVENQEAVWRIADLEATPAAKRFASFEPLLQSIYVRGKLKKVDYAVLGCESGPKARLCDLGDIRYMMDQCRLSKTKIHIKQVPLNGKCNKNIKEWPEEFRVREV